MVLLDYVECAGASEWVECVDEASESLLRLSCVWRPLYAPTVSTKLQLFVHLWVCMSGLNGGLGWFCVICCSVVRSSASSICCAATLCHALPRMTDVAEQGSQSTVLPQVSNSDMLAWFSLSAMLYGKSVFG